MVVPTVSDFNQITSPDLGMLVFKSPENKLFFYNGSVWGVVSSTSGSGLSLPFSESAPSSTSLFEVTNTNTISPESKGIIGKVNGEGVGVLGMATKLDPTITIGVLGKNSSTGLGGFGVKGEHEGAGIGVHGSVKGNGTAIMGVVINSPGVAVKGVANNAGGIASSFESTNGYALKSYGKVQIAGGDTSPQPGKVLMAQNIDGDAKWQEIKQNPQVGFHAKLNQKIFNNSNTEKVFQFSVPEFEDGADPNGYDLIDVNLGKFNVLETGVYLIDFSMSWTTANTANTTLKLRKNNAFALDSNVFTDTKSNERMRLYVIAKLNAGDYVEPVVTQNSTGNLTVNSLIFNEGFTAVKIY
jgi:hypothetical protein